MGGYLLSHSVEDGILKVAFTGDCDARSAPAMAREYFALVASAGQRRVLADIRHLRGRLPLGGTFQLVRDLSAGPPFTAIRTAILESAPNEAYARFLEDTTVNAGFDVRCFLEPGAARAWLAQPSPGAS
jgi:hypothetical protein